MRIKIKPTKVMEHLGIIWNQSNRRSYWTKIV